MTGNLDRVLAKIRALRALAQSANVNEAAAAAAQADALIQKYRLDSATVDGVAAEPAEECSRDPEPVDVQAVGGKNRIRWRGALLTILARHYSCVAITEPRQYVVQSFVIGCPSDVAIVRYMFAWSSAEIVRLSQVWDVGEMRRSFCEGAVAGFREALAASKVKAEVGHDKAALVLRDRAAAALALLDKLYPDRGRGRATSSGNAWAYAHGVAAGKGMNRPTGLPSPGSRLLGPGKK